MAPTLVKYGEVVQDLAARGHNWKFYNENVRFLRQWQPASFPWGGHSLGIVDALSNICHTQSAHPAPIVQDSFQHPTVRLLFKIQ